MVKAILAVLLGGALACAPAAAAQGGSSTVNVSDAPGASTAPGCTIDSADTIHLAWADNPDADATAGQFLYYARSRDGGATFEAPRRLPTDADAGRKPHEIRVVTTAAGAVAIAWWDVVVEPDGHVFVTAFFVHSTDGGATFAPAVQTSIRYRDDGAAKEGFRNTTSLSLAPAPDGGFGLLATVPDVFRGFNVYFARTENSETFSSAVRVTNYTVAIPRAASNALAYLPNGDLYAVWSQSVGDFINEIRDVLYSVSSDGGRSFSAPTQLAHVRGVVGAVLRAGGATELVTQSQKNDHTLAVTKLYRSNDGGRTFPARARVARPAGFSHLHENSVAANAGGVVAVAWTENSSRLGAEDGIYVAVSRDGGKHFAAPQLVVAGLFIDPPSVVVDSAGHVGVAFSSSAASLADREVLFVRADA